MNKMKLAALDGACGTSMMAYAASMAATPVCLIVLMREMNLSLTAGGALETMRSLLLTAMLIFSGISASRFEKTTLITTGNLLLTGGLFLYGAAPSYPVILGAMFLIGTGGGLLEALLNPLIQDLHPGDSGRYLNMVNAFFSVGVLLTVLVTGELLSRNIPWQSIMTGLGLFFGLNTLFFLITSWRARKKGKLPVKTCGNPLKHAWHFLTQSHFWLFALAMLCAGGVEAAYTFWLASYTQIHYGALPRAGGIATALFAGGMITGRLGSAFVPQHRLPLLIGFSASTGFCFSLGFFLLEGLGSFMLLLFLAGLSTACFWPSIQSYGADRIKGDSTVLFILLSIGGIPGFSLASWGIGRIGDIWGLRTSFGLIPVLFALLLLCLILERYIPNSKASRPELQNQ